MKIAKGMVAALVILAALAGLSSGYTFVQEVRSTYQFARLLHLATLQRQREQAAARQQAAPVKAPTVAAPVTVPEAP
jgi:hypothetical protein